MPVNERLKIFSPTKVELQETVHYLTLLQGSSSFSIFQPEFRKSIDLTLKVLQRDIDLLDG